MANKIFLLGLFLLSVANVKAQTRTQTDSLTMETMLHNLPEVMVKGSRPIVKAERGMLSYNIPLLLKQLPADNAYEALTRIPGVSDATGSISFSVGRVLVYLEYLPAAQPILDTQGAEWTGKHVSGQKNGHP